MHHCNICNYLTDRASFLKTHLKSKKHILKSMNIEISEIDKINEVIEVIENSEINETNEEIKKEDEDILYCSFCNKKYIHNSSLSRHIKNCNKKPIDIIISKEIKEKDKEIKKIKKELTDKLKIEKLKNKIKELEKNKNGNIINNITNIQNNNIIHISRLDNLNLNFGNVINMTTFIENFKGKFGLNEIETKKLLDHYETMSIEIFTKSLFYYLKQSAIKQYKEILGKDINEDDIVLPFLLSDKSIRDHFEKNNEGKWDRIILYANIQKILDYIVEIAYEHHEFNLNLFKPQRKKIIELLLKRSGYSNLTKISIPELYKTITD